MTSVCVTDIELHSIGNEMGNKQGQEEKTGGLSNWLKLQTDREMDSLKLCETVTIQIDSHAHFIPSSPFSHFPL